MERDELAGWLRLALTYAVDGAAARRLLASFGLPPAILQQEASVLAQVIGRAAADSLHREPEGFQAKLEETWAWLERDPGQRAILTLGDTDYPASLLAIEDPPLMLYAQGRLGPAPQ